MFVRTDTIFGSVTGIDAGSASIPSMLAKKGFVK